MKKLYYLIFIALLNFGTTHAQTLSVEGFLTNGNILEEKHRAGKAGIGLGSYYHLSDKWLVGFELGTGGNFLPVDGSAFDGNFDVLDPSFFSYNTMLLKCRYYFVEKFLNGRLYSSISAGYAKYFRRISDENIKQIANRTFTIIPEIGLSLDRVNLSIQYFPPFDTPSFSGVVNDTPTRLEAGRYSMIMLRFGYQYPLIR